jgi:hypothetical protein
VTRRKDDPPDDSDGDSRERQERVIHTRVSERLEQELKDRAASLGVSVSNLVRNVLDNAFELVEDVLADSARVASSATSGWRAGRGAARRASAEPTVVGWQEIVLNLNAICSKCNAILPRGQEAAIGIVTGSGDRPILCRSCLEEIRDANYPVPDEPDPDQRRKR